MKTVNVDDVLKILHKYGKYVFVTDKKKYSSMVDEIANLKALKQEPILDKIRAEIKGWQADIHDNEYDADKYDFVFERIFEILDEYKAESEVEE